MSMKRLLVVCRYNQARSIVIGAVLRKLFPDLEIVTAGIEAPHGKQVPAITSQLCREWRLPSFDRISVATDSLDLGEFEAILALDQIVFDALISDSLKSKLYSLYDFSESDFLIPVDPTGMPFELFKVEISKAIILALRFIRGTTGYISNTIESFFFETERALLSWLSSTESQRFKLLIDANIAIPNHDLWSRSTWEYKLIDYRSELSGQLTQIQNLGPIAIVSRFETDLVADVFLSSKWVETLSRVSSLEKVALIALGDERRPESLVEAILGFAHSAKFQHLA